MNTTIRPHILVAVSFFAIWLSGCTTRAYGTVYSDTPVVVAHSQPELVVIEPGISVVCDQYAPVYYHAGFYWHYEAGVWYRAARWGGPRVRIHSHLVPGALVWRDHRQYVQYRGHGHAYANHQASARRAPRGYHKVPARPARATARPHRNAHHPSASPAQPARQERPRAPAKPQRAPAKAQRASLGAHPQASPRMAPRAATPRPARQEQRSPVNRERKASPRTSRTTPQHRPGNERDLARNQPRSR